jgi:sporulation protein YlmC with PRC-barrel domain
MTMKYVAAALLASSLLSAPAFAQSAPKPAGSNATSAQTMMQKLGTWRTSKLIGLNVYNNNNEKIGDINELITDASGKIDVVVIGVGGFLGIGERNVGLPLNQVKFVMEPRPANTASASTTRTTTTGAGTPEATTTTTTTMAGNRDYPDHAVLNMTKDQLAALPALKYLSEASSTTSRTSPAPAR